MAASAGVPALAVELLPPLDICEARAAARTEHPTVGPGAEALTVVRRMAADFVPVGIGEGFAGVLRAVSDADAAALAARLGQAGPAVPRPDLEGWQGLPAVPGGGRRRADDRESWRAAPPVDGGARVAAWGGRGACWTVYMPRWLVMNPAIAAIHGAHISAMCSSSHSRWGRWFHSLY